MAVRRLFNSQPHDWAHLDNTASITANQIRNVTSARISVPSIIVPAPSNPKVLRSHPFTWRTPLRSTAAYWQSKLLTYPPYGGLSADAILLGWFLGLSSSFLAARTARLLVLAGTDRLDKELMIGQMQGKFQMNVVPNTGHMLHEVGNFFLSTSRTQHADSVI